jgi:hypothetical protein
MIPSPGIASIAGDPSPVVAPLESNEQAASANTTQTNRTSSILSQAF